MGMNPCNTTQLNWWGRKTLVSDDYHFLKLKMSRLPGLAAFTAGDADSGAILCLAGCLLT